MRDRYLYNPNVQFVSKAYRFIVQHKRLWKYRFKVADQTISGAKRGSEFHPRLYSIVHDAVQHDIYTISYPHNTNPLKRTYLSIIHAAFRDAQQF